MEFDAITWNLFNGRDFPPDPALFTWRSRLLGTEERNDTHLQVNRDLLDEFAAVLSAAALGRRAAPGVPTPLGRPARRRLRRRDAPHAHRPQLARLDPRRARPPQPRPDGLLGRRLEPHPRQGAARRRDQRAARARSSAAGPSVARWTSSDSSPASAWRTSTPAAPTSSPSPTCGGPPRPPSPGPATTRCSWAAT